MTFSLNTRAKETREIITNEVGVDSILANDFNR